MLTYFIHSFNTVVNSVCVAFEFCDEELLVLDIIPSITKVMSESSSRTASATAGTFVTVTVLLSNCNSNSINYSYF